MNNENEQDRKKPLSLGGRSTLELRKSPETSSIRQSFSHGRSKTVTVEVKRKRILETPATPAAPAPPAAFAPVTPVPAAAPEPAPASAPEQTEALTPTPDAPTLTPDAPLASAPDAPDEPTTTSAAPDAPATATTPDAPSAPAAQAETRAETRAETGAEIQAETGAHPPAPPEPAQAPSKIAAPKIAAPARVAPPASARVAPPVRVAPPSAPARVAQPTSRQARNKPTALHALSEGERAARMRALQGAIRADEEARVKAEEEARQRALREQAEAISRAARELEAREAEQAARDSGPPAQPDAALSTQPAEPTKRSAATTPTTTPSMHGPSTHGPRVAVAADAAAARTRSLAADEDEDEAARVKRAGPGKPEVRRPTPAKRTESRRQTGKLTVVQALDGDQTERVRSLASVRRAREREQQRAQESGPEKVVREVIIPDQLTVQDLAARMATRGVEVIKALMRMGVMATINQMIDGDTAELIVGEFGHTVKRASDSDVEVGLVGEADNEADLQPRAPVVTVMGHVDHGKTSLLDALRKADVAAREAGGITQHIGAYCVTLDDGHQITFIDTPGHEAFTEMRARGAHVTDIVVLVVAADDGIMPQTVEAIHHAKAADAPIIVAINKIDKHEANAQRVRTELLQHGLVVEELGGDVLAVEVSAKTGLGLDKLRETILLQAEILDLKANPNRNAEGVVVEARLDRGRGPVATVLVQRGTLRVGDIFVAGSEWGKVRALVNDRGEQVSDAGPVVPVEVLGLAGTPNAGDELQVVGSESRAREISSFRQRRRRDSAFKIAGRGTVEQMLSKIAAGEAQELPLVIKSDVQGSMEAIIGALGRLGTDEVQTRILYAGVGAISEADVTLARASGALIIAFNVRANAQARELARRDNVDIRYYSVIYNVVDDVRAALTGLLAPGIREEFLGYAQIRDVFNITKVGRVAGCMITEGLVKRGARVRLLRDNVVIHEGTLKTLRRFREEVREVKQGFECGMAFENYDDIKVNDQIECFEIIEEARTL